MIEPPQQAVKAIAIAWTYLQPGEFDLVCVPEFAAVVVDGKERTAMRLLVERRAVNAPSLVP